MPASILLSMFVLFVSQLAHDGDVLDGAQRPLSLHAYLAEQLQDEPSTVCISIIVKIIHNLVVLSHQLLVPLIITAAKLLVHYAELQLPERSEGWLKVQTLRVKRYRCDT